MGTSAFVSLERQIPDLPDMDGKVLARDLDRLDELAAKLNLSSLCGFFGMSGHEMADLVGQNLGKELPEAKWFAPAQGLAVVKGLLAHLRVNDPDNGAIPDLLVMEQILRKAQDAGVRWRLAIDI